MVFSLVMAAVFSIPQSLADKYQCRVCLDNYFIEGTDNMKISVQDSNLVPNTVTAAPGNDAEGYP
jgi:hypothetical protein